MQLTLLPAVDVKDGLAVRLVQGELQHQTTYGAPLAAALDFQTAGAQWLHLVDLDAAFGRGSNLPSRKITPRSYSRKILMHDRKYTTTMIIRITGV